MATKSHHVVPDPDGGWSVIKRDAARASKHFDNKEDAVVWGRQISRKHGTEFVIHRKDGTVEAKDSVSSTGADALRQGICVKRDA